MNNYDDARLTALRLLKGMFKNYVNEFDVFEDKDFAYECAVKRIQLLACWDEFKDEVLQWYDFEILGLRYE
tara:strand:+ start:48 stop:260 length:213 start_codon:yes stop_codon:yes gene_type:complete